MREPVGSTYGVESFLGHGVPRRSAGDQEMVVVEEDAVAQIVTLEVGPDTFDGVEFGTVGRQVEQGDVFGNLEPLGHMPARLVHHQYDVLVGTGLSADEREVRVHVVGIDCWREHGRRIAGCGVHGGEQVDPVVLGLFDGGGT